MIVADTVERVREALRPLRAKGPVALVPTMGALHEGHLSLVRRARREARVVVVSIFVNPLQFGPAEDFARYPRMLPEDLSLLENEGVDVAFCPAAADFYPPNFSTSVSVEEVSRRQEGAVRPGHFTGVATVVAKLFNAVGPDLAVFGRKDLQQAAVIQRMVRDLDFPVRVVVAPISREADGLARSSRNVYLSAQERRAAAVLPRALRSAARAIERGSPAAEAEAQTRRDLESGGLRVDYVELVDPATVEPVAAPSKGTVLAAAARIGKVRLLDNVELEAVGVASAAPSREAVPTRASH